jgi:hypothetical protein
VPIRATRANGRRSRADLYEKCECSFNDRDVVLSDAAATVRPQRRGRNDRMRTNLWCVPSSRLFIAVPSAMGRRFAACRAHGPGELRLAVGTAGLSRECVEEAAAAVGVAYPERADCWRDAALWACDIRTTGAKLENQAALIGHRTTITSGNGKLSCERITAK